MDVINIFSVYRLTISFPLVQDEFNRFTYSLEVSMPLGRKRLFLSQGR